MNILRQETHPLVVKVVPANNRISIKDKFIVLIQACLELEGFTEYTLNYDISTPTGIVRDGPTDNTTVYISTHTHRVPRSPHKVIILRGHGQIHDSTLVGVPIVNNVILCTTT